VPRPWVGRCFGSLEIVAQFEDFTARRVAEEALSDQALRDAVTELPNRRALSDRIGSALQRLRRNPGLVAVLFCDLDRFKDVNDSMGHQVGDEMLVEVARRLRAALRPQDTVARLGETSSSPWGRDWPVSPTPCGWRADFRSGSVPRGCTVSNVPAVHECGRR
jgi:hypothetical protein